jgi:hypothetical protein
MPKARIWDAKNSVWLELDAKNAELAARATIATDAELLGGKSPSHYATAQSVTDADTALANHKISTTDHAIATALTNGFMSKENYEKLLAISAGANKVTVTTEGSGFIEIDGVSKKVIDTLGAGNITEDATHRFTTDTEKAYWNAKLDASKRGVANGVASLDADGLVPISQLPNVVKEGKVVATYADMIAITAANKFEGLHVLVTDAAADPTVDSGYAEYVYDGSKFVKVSEGESLDLVLSWANLLDKPTATVIEIDTAVANTHEHANAAVLDAMTAAFTTELKAKIDAIRAEATKTEASGTNGNIIINGIEVPVYRHPASHTASEINDFAVEVAKVKVANAVHADTADNASLLNGFNLFISGTEPTANKVNGTIWIDAPLSVV